MARAVRCRARKTSAVTPWLTILQQGVECRKDEDVINETPMAYKSIDAVMEAQKGLVETRPHFEAGCVREGLKNPIWEDLS